MKKHKTKKAKRGRQIQAPENTTRDLVIANRVSGKVHGGLSRIRLSLTFRIALHYCVQLLRSFIPVALILSVVLCFAVSYPVTKKLNGMLPTEPDETQRVISEGDLTAQVSDIPPESSFFPLTVTEKRFGVPVGLPAPTVIRCRPSFRPLNR